MYCLGCHYELHGLDSRRCPECGRTFDPGNPDSFATTRHHWPHARKTEIALIALGTVPLLAATLAHAALLVARLSLGRWPNRVGADDPKGIDFLGPLPLLAVLLLLASVPALITGVGLASVLAAHRAWPRLLRGGLLAAGLWATGFALARWDPAQTWTWIFD